MAIKADKWIRKMALEKKMIEPFEEKQVRKGVISYGLSSYGYDIRVADEFKLFTDIYSTLVDPKKFDPKSFVDMKADSIIIPPNSPIAWRCSTISPADVSISASRRRACRATGRCSMLTA